MLGEHWYRGVTSTTCVVLGMRESLRLTTAIIYSQNHWFCEQRRYIESILYGSPVSDARHHVTAVAVMYVMLEMTRSSSETRNPRMLHMNELDCGRHPCWGTMPPVCFRRHRPLACCVWRTNSCMRSHVQVAKVPTPFPKDKNACRVDATLSALKNDIKADET